MVLTALIHPFIYPGENLFMPEPFILRLSGSMYKHLFRPDGKYEYPEIWDDVSSSGAEFTLIERYEIIGRMNDMSICMSIEAQCTL